MTKPMADPYAVLGVARDADEQQVRDAYRGLAKRYHPDLHPDEATSARMRRVNAAWDVLSDPARRARYDTSAHAGARTTMGARAAGWGASPWTTPARPQPRPRSDIRASSGPPWAALLVVLVVGWLAIGGVFGGLRRFVDSHEPISAASGVGDGGDSTAVGRFGFGLVDVVGGAKEAKEGTDAALRPVFPRFLRFLSERKRTPSQSWRCPTGHAR
jgi:curved DNA-binding protein CbpA